MDEIRALYEKLWSVHGDRYARFDVSLNPRSPEILYDLAAGAGLHSGSAVLDAGCGRANHAIRLAQRFGCRVFGFDLLADPMLAACDESPEVAGRVYRTLASASELPYRAASFDLIWCRDMLVHVPDLQRAFAEAACVLKGNGSLLAHITQATSLLEPAEARRIYGPLAVQGQNLDRLYFENALAGAGLRIQNRIGMASEWIEFYEEQDGRASRELLRIARMRRTGLTNREDEAAYAVYHWLVYHLLGKLETVVYLLQK